MSNEVVFVVDMINGFCKEGALHDKKILRVIPMINKLIDGKPNAEIVVIEDGHLKGSQEFKSFPEHCLIGTNESETIDELKYLFKLPNYKTTFKKNSTNAFHVIREYLNGKVNNVKNYYIVGCCTDICISNLALSLKTYLNELNIDANVVVVSDCVETYDAPNHSANDYNDYGFKIMSISGVDIRSTEEVLKGKK